MADNNKFTLGANATLHITDENGDVNLGLAIRDFQSKADNEVKKIPLMNGRTPSLEFKQGYSGSFTIVRQGPELDKYFAAQEARYYNGIFTSNITITQTIKEPDGSITQFQFVNVVLNFEDAGTYQNNSEVDQKVSFMAERRLVR